jgi:hypothetical protein
MDYKQIEQLLDRYWRCETSLKEEAELRDFFIRTDTLPAHLLPFKSLFVYQKAEQKQQLGDDFDQRVLAKVEPVVVKIKHLSLTTRLKPLFKAAAIVAFVFGLSGVLEHAFYHNEASDYNYDAYTDTYDDPQVAYKEVSSALMMLSKSINKSREQHVVDSLSTIKNDKAIEE